jgi:arginase family enzyme
MQALTALVASPLLSALTITEINPNHGAEDGSTLTTFVEALARVLASSPAITRSAPI